MQLKSEGMLLKRQAPALQEVSNANLNPFGSYTKSSDAFCWLAGKYILKERKVTEDLYDSHFESASQIQAFSPSFSA